MAQNPDIAEATDRVAQQLSRIASAARRLGDAGTAAALQAVAELLMTYNHRSMVPELMPAEAQMPGRAIH